MIILLYDYDGTADFVSVVASCAGSLGLDCKERDGIGVEEALIAAADVMIVHAPSDIWERMVQQAKVGARVVRVSSGGFPVGPGPRRTERGTYVLHLVMPPVQMERAGWLKILDDLSEESSTGRILDPESKGVRAQFFSSLPRHYLECIAILCQGYLAAQDIGRSGREKWPPEEVRHALDRMGWTTLKSNVPEVASQLATKAPTVADVGARMWWSSWIDVNPGTEKAGSVGVPDLKNRLAEEWGGALDVSVSELIDEIGRDRVQPVVVARAYLAIAGRLSG